MTGRLSTVLDGQTVVVIAEGEAITVSPGRGVLMSGKSLIPFAIKVTGLFERLGIETKIVLWNRYLFRLTPRRIRILQFVAGR